MGTLVFQATLGGSVNLIGPNTASTVNFTLPSADGTSGQALTTNGSGTLSFGTLAIGGGGTGQTTANAAFNALAPSQTGNSGKYLTTDGTNTSWATNAGGDVTGPSSATANGIVLFNSTTGKLIKDSAASDGLIYGITVGRGAGAVATNTAVGASALSNGSLSGGNNSAFGYQPATALTTGTDNLIAGYQAGNAVTTGARNTILGSQSGQSLTVGSDNILIGYRTIYNAASTGSYNVALGNQALYSNTTASNSTAVGYQAGYSNTTGGITAFGYQAGYANQTGLRCVFLGRGSGYSSTGDNNTFVGYGAGNASTGVNNTFVGGYNSSFGAAGGDMTTGSKNTILGTYTGNQGGLDIRTASNYIVLSDGDGTPRVYVNDSGQLLKSGDSTSSRILPATDNVGYVGSSGNRWQAIYAVNGTIQTSDGRQKNTIQDSNLGLAFVNSLRPVSYKWNVGENVVTYSDDGEPVVTPRSGIRTHYGFIAQEVKSVIPDGVDFGGFVEEPNDGQMSLRYHEFIGPLVKAIQELKAEFDAYKASHP